MESMDFAFKTISALRDFLDWNCYSLVIYYIYADFNNKMFYLMDYPETRKGQSLIINGLRADLLEEFKQESFFNLIPDFK